MAKNTVPITIWGVPVWKGGGRQNISHLETPRNHKVFVTIWGLTYIPRYSYQKNAMPVCSEIEKPNNTLKIIVK
jgi:hypothetical protein